MSRVTVPCLLGHGVAIGLTICKFNGRAAAGTLFIQPFTSPQTQHIQFHIPICAPLRVRAKHLLCAFIWHRLCRSASGVLISRNSDCQLLFTLVSPSSVPSSSSSSSCFCTTKQERPGKSRFSQENQVKKKILVSKNEKNKSHTTHDSKMMTIIIIICV